MMFEVQDFEYDMSNKIAIWTKYLHDKFWRQCIIIIYNQFYVLGNHICINQFVICL